MANPHGIVLGPPECGHFRNSLRTDDKRVRIAPPEFVGRMRELLAEPHPTIPADYPFLLGNRRNRHSMNSWLNEIPGLHPGGRRNDVLINPSDAADLGIGQGDRVRVFSPTGEVEVHAALSDRPRRGVIVMEHGWGSTIFDPRGGASARAYGANRNLVVDGATSDPLSQTSALNASFVGLERIGDPADPSTRNT